MLKGDLAPNVKGVEKWLGAELWNSVTLKEDRKHLEFEC
jgi:hypothetical protein